MTGDNKEARRTAVALARASLDGDEARFVALLTGADVIGTTAALAGLAAALATIAGEQAGRSGGGCLDAMALHYAADD